ncbi:hypothetical protein SAMN05216535_3229 [Stutzerimonas xanthomarina]|uniref:Uncharacterized protein n=2 Tax=Stutzerimonas xanthomarina TaxID=271420 RepID=A0A1M5SAR6_9GAMM|nr:hypothetical protein SAMN05216535_3229 [Stutzerimonas xanthomarina]SHH35579.1 hypothetical protein SAMN02744645_3377 [Stutzerimonas xanthomarina DSM 18231]
MMPHKQNRLSSTSAGHTPVNQPLNAELIVEKGSDSFVLALEKASSYVSFRSALQKSVLLCETLTQNTRHKRSPQPDNYNKRTRYEIHA